MNILEKIIEHKISEVERRKTITTSEQLELRESFSRKTISLKAALLNETNTGIIAEFKRMSPSRGTINDNADVEDTTAAYTKYGASGLSVLTDEYFFGGSTDDLVKARVNDIPILRKDFIIDEYQVTETKAMGADVILLIAACLTPAKVRELAMQARSLGLETLLEIHNEEELRHICDEIDLVGINNRDLKTFEVDIDRSVRLSKQIPADKIIIAESGIDMVETIRIFKVAGFKGFLIGEKFMKADDPATAFEKFVQQLKTTMI